MVEFLSAGPRASLFRGGHDHDLGSANIFGEVFVLTS